MKYVAGGFAFAFFTLLMVLLIRHESAGMRDTIKQAQNETVEETLDRAPEMATRAAGRMVGRVISMPTSDNAPGRSNEKAPATSEPAAPSEPATTSTPTTPPAASPPTLPGGLSLPLPKEPLSVDPVAAVGGLFDAGRQVVKSVDDAGQQTFAIGDKQAEEIGAEVNKMVLHKYKVFVNPKQEARVHSLAEPIIALCKRKGVKYTFTLLDDPTVNAFSHVGGYVYVHRGLLELLPDDTELQFVLAHEIGHVDLKHCDRGLNYTATLGKLTHVMVGELAQMAYHLIAVGYQKDLEFDADEYAFRDLIQLGRTRDEALSCSRHMAKYAREKKIETALPKPASAAGAVVVEVENHFRSHPPADERVKRLESIKL
jgi:Peptidase family M48